MEYTTRVTRCRPTFGMLGELLGRLIFLSNNYKRLVGFTELWIMNRTMFL